MKKLIGSLLFGLVLSFSFAQDEAGTIVDIALANLSSKLNQHRKVVQVGM